MKAMARHPRGQGAVELALGMMIFVSILIAGIYFATTINSDIPLSGSGSAALIIGVVFTLILGVGLMALIFFSSRNGFDEPPDVQ